ncbi:MAG TPA: hypothetical protein VLA34_02585 [Candidatus Krumholzibacterium sp.]|nr:hypothetical protein [Candidatus Krumholzibacterium sp.]
MIFPGQPEPVRSAVQRAFAGLCLMIVLCQATVARADDSPYYRKGWKIHFGLHSGFIKQDYNLDNKLKVKIPDYLIRDLESGNKGWLLDLDEGTISDNPLLHGAMYGRFSVSAGKDGVSLATEIIAEHRGASYGVYSSENTIVIPRFLAAIDTSFGDRFGGLRFGILAGNLDDFVMGEGLTIYNIDVQGAAIYLGAGKARVTYTQIADLSAGIGLGIGDLYDLSLSVRDITLPLSLSLKAEAGYFSCYIDRAVDDELPDRGLNLSASIEHDSSFRLYTPAGIRDAGEEVEQDSRSMAHLVGAGYRLERGRLSAGLVAERRYYGRYFNLGYKSGDSSFMYRTGDGSTIGSHLYPLTSYLRPLSQWAVYTEYQGRDVLSWIFRCDAKYRLVKGLDARMVLDLNHIDVSNEDSFVYPFYDAGIIWEPTEGFTFGLSHTNRGMNLDMHYPTLYLLEPGTFMITLNADLDF